MCLYFVSPFLLGTHQCRAKNIVSFAHVFLCSRFKCEKCTERNTCIEYMNLWTIWLMVVPKEKWKSFVFCESGEDLRRQYLAKVIYIYIYHSSTNAFIPQNIHDWKANNCEAPLVSTTNDVNNMFRPNKNKTRWNKMNKSWRKICKSFSHSTIFNILGMYIEKYISVGP